MMLLRFLLIAAALLVLQSFVPAVHAQQGVSQKAVKPLAFTGVNLSGGEFDEPKPGVKSVYGQSYIFPSNSELGCFAGKGVNVIRF